MLLESDIVEPKIIKLGLISWLWFQSQIWLLSKDFEGICLKRPKDKQYNTLGFFEIIRLVCARPQQSIRF